MNDSPLYEKLAAEGADVYYEAGFRNELEYHLIKLAVSNAAQTKDIPGDQAMRFEHDFYGMLKEQGVPPYLWWIVMRINNMKHPFEFTSDRKIYTLPDHQEVDRIRVKYTTVHNIR